MKGKTVFRMLLIAIGILTVDMISKALTHFYIAPYELASHFFPFGGINVFQAYGIDFCIHHVTNKGIAWGLGGGIQEVILFVRIAVIAGLIIYLIRSPKAYPQRYPLVLIIAGGIGNIVDYFIYGHVVDMFHFILRGYSYPVFNIADSSIFFGIITLLLKSWKKPSKQDAASKIPS